MHQPRRLLDVIVMQHFVAILLLDGPTQRRMNWLSEQPVRCEEEGRGCRPMQITVRSKLPAARDEQNWRLRQKW
jgi:hypothetical protein